ncbi:MAG: hypothetical protein ACM3W4_01700 [Ignavibacteriales bacterium]
MSDDLFEAMMFLRRSVTRLKQENAALAQSNRRLREGLGAAARVFRDYQALHLIKDTAEGREKSARNREHAEMCEAALKDSALGDAQARTEGGEA